MWPFESKSPKPASGGAAPAFTCRHTDVDRVPLRTGETVRDLNGLQMTVHGGDAHGLMCRDCGCVEGL